MVLEDDIILNGLDESERRDNFDFVSQLEYHPDLTVTQYDAMSRWCENAIRQNLDFLYDTTLFEYEIQSTARKLHVPVSSLTSFIQHEHVFHIKKSSRNVYSRLSYHVQRFVNGDESIITIAKSLRYSPYLMARKILEELNPSLSRTMTTKVMRDPNGNSLEPHLIEQITHVLEKDPMYGPDHDTRRHNIGIEYERKLETLLTIIGIPFETEDQLRERGTSKTPDILLSTPVAVQIHRTKDEKEKSISSRMDENQEEEETWRIVCWIDSKAMFGDVRTHQFSVLPQAESYIHRFGPGLILYWFGHAPQLEDAHGDLVLCGWTLPEEFLLPTGEILSQPKR